MEVTSACFYAVTVPPGSRGSDKVVGRQCLQHSRDLRVTGRRRLTENVNSGRLNLASCCKIFLTGPI